MKVSFGKPFINNLDIKKISKVLENPILAHGNNIINFEKRFRKFTLSKYSLSLNSCMSALHLCSMCINLKKGDEVIVSSMTHVATVNAIEATGAKPIFVDCNLIDGNIDINKIENYINKRTRAIYIVHFLGIPADLEKIIYLTKKNKIFLIEDCALALGSKFNNIHVGNHGDFGCFSFYPAKHITTGEGGMLVLKKKKFLDLSKLLRGHGVDRGFQKRKIPGQYDVIVNGYNFRMSEINAALGITQMNHINKIINLRRKNFKLLKSLIDYNIGHVLDSNCKKKFVSNYALTLFISDINEKLRNKIIKDLLDFEIGLSVYYPKPVSEFKYYKNKYKVNSKNVVNALNLSRQSITFPVGPHLEKKHIEYMADKINTVIKKNV